MPRRIWDDRRTTSQPTDRGRRSGRRRLRPTLDGLESRQLLSEVVPAATASVISPQPAASQAPEANIPLVIRHTQLPPLRAWSAQPFEGAVASFISNAQLPVEMLSATIAWGDGQTSSGDVELSPWGGFNVRGTHTYAPDSSGLTWVRVDLTDARTGDWLAGVEQRMLVTRTSPSRAALFSSGYQPATARHEPVSRPQPMRLRLVERRQRFYDAADRFAQGAASAEDLRYLRQVKEFQDQQNKGFFEKVGDSFSDAFPF